MLKLWGVATLWLNTHGSTLLSKYGHFLMTIMPQVVVASVFLHLDIKSQQSSSSVSIAPCVQLAHWWWWLHKMNMMTSGVLKNMRHMRLASLQQSGWILHCNKTRKVFVSVVWLRGHDVWRLTVSAPPEKMFEPNCGLILSDTTQRHQGPHLGFY